MSDAKAVSEAHTDVLYAWASRAVALAPGLVAMAFKHLANEAWKQGKYNSSAKAA